MTTTQVDAFSDALSMVHALRERRISAVELLDLHLQRIHRYNPRLNAVVTPSYERARESAAAADSARARGENGRLLGLPMTIKDCIDVAGLPTTGGVVDRADAVATEDARPVARIRAAGAVIMGKTNVPPYASDWQSDNPLFGRTCNPWDLERTPGGSSGGAAAAIAAGLAPLELGGDFMGSIRVPAAFCGVYGHKPTLTAMPGTGHFPAGLLPNPTTALAVIGPLARSAEDLELALEVGAGPEIGEDAAWRLALPPARHDRLGQFRVAVLPVPDWLPLDDEIGAALERVSVELARRGVKVERAQPASLGNLREYYELYLSIVGSIESIGRPPEKRVQAAERFRASGDWYLAAYGRGVDAQAAEYIAWHGKRESYRAAYRAFFRDWDVLLAPANIVNAFPHMDAPFGQRKLEVNGRSVRYGLQSFFAGLANLTGNPSTAFPVGFTRSHLPIGLQAIGPYLEDRTSIRFAACLARELGGYLPPPGYA